MYGNETYILRSPKLCQVKRHCKVFKQNYTSNSGSQSGNNRNSCSCANICTNTDSGSCGNICTNTDSSSNSQCCNSRIFFILENQYSSRIYSINVKYFQYNCTKKTITSIINWNTLGQFDFVSFDC